MEQTTTKPSEDGIWKVDPTPGAMRIVDDSGMVVGRFATVEKVLVHLAFEMQRARRNAAPRWIPVGERLPDQWAFVVVFTPGVGADVASIEQVRFGEKGPFVRADGRTLSRVTHWMPLPPSPNSAGCNCWLGTSATHGDSRIREQCPVHGNGKDGAP